MKTFDLDTQLDADTILLGRLGLCLVLLMNDARYPWLILVPELPDLAEIIDLSPADQAILMQDMSAASEALKTIYRPDKLNIGALGNRVRQLHVHVIARFQSDQAWPAPVWGVGQSRSYPPHMAAVVADRLTTELKAHGLRETA